MRLLTSCNSRHLRILRATRPTSRSAAGSFPAALKRTKPYGYSIFQLDQMATLCQILSTPEDDPWAFELPDGRGIRRAVAWLHPYLVDKASWPKPPDVEHWEGWPASLFCSLLG